MDEWFGVNCLVESESKGRRLVVGWVWLLILLELLPCVAGANTRKACLLAKCFKWSRGRGFALAGQAPGVALVG